MSSKFDIFEKKIKNIYFSPTFHNSIFFDTSDDTRFKFDYYSVSFADTYKATDLYYIDKTEILSEILNREVINIHDYTPFLRENDNCELEFDNKKRIRIFNNNLIVDNKEYKLDMNLISENKKAPYLSQNQLKYKDIVEYFDRNKFGSNMPVLSHLSMLYPSDRIEILKRIMDNGTENLYTYDKLSMAYAKNGELLFGLNILNVGSLKDVIDPFNFEMMTQKISGMSKTVPFELKTQLDYYGEKKINGSQIENEFLILLENFAKENYK